MLAATGAEALSVISRIQHTTFYDRGELRRAVGGGVMTEIIGSPTASATPEEIAAALELPSSIGDKRFKPIEQGSAPDGARLVLVFNPKGVFSGDDACAASGDLVGAAADGPLAAYAVMCQGDSFYAQGQISDSGVTGLGPDFTSAMRRLFLAMFPARNPELRDDDRGWSMGFTTPSGL